MKVDRLVLVVDDDAIVLRILADQIARAANAEQFSLWHPEFWLLAPMVFRK